MGSISDLAKKMPDELKSAPGAGNFQDIVKGQNKYFRAELKKAGGKRYVDLYDEFTELAELGVIGTTESSADLINVQNSLINGKGAGKSVKDAANKVFENNFRLGRWSDETSKISMYR